ncbi:beta-galactosidase [Streptomyces sp. DSM 44915]|uniref:Beta-galactosidase n=1 Tax=Streptomyces chisholmiae TaxID=3075540 RepID=A0ABU2JUM9_9ACTN|nr:beta-galactosidase [Streptomyces sp. DSM 44915]MDT0268691.1 beta-galactosidase [Streptomyces sp. DSM 44915]
MTQNPDGTQPPPADQTAPPRHLRVPPPAPVTPAPLDMGDPAGLPGGIRLTSRHVERDGAPWFPVMGEYHFSRDLPEHWERELRKMRAGGVNVVATYLLWIIHEEVRGDIRWDGHRDLRRFVETADRVGLQVVIRIGPWAHGETRNGGFPDWVQALPVAHRTDDPAYLELASGWYAAIAEQVRGLCHGPDHPDGPIIGVQVDNELYDQPEHLRTLRELAHRAGMRPSLWVATGWGGARLPAGALLPVYAGYSDAFWEESTTGWPAFGVLHFTFTTVRDDLSVGADLRDAPAEARQDAAPDGDDPWPFATCELGGGMQGAYHRRPLVDPDDIAALALTKLGSGSAWQGYYLYHGATQVVGDLSTTQESHATGYPNDLPVRDYDFFAPLGAVGGQRPHFHQLRRQHLMLEAFGGQFAAHPSVLPSGEDGVRWAVRGDGERGYLFLNNHQPAAAALPDVPDVRFAVELTDRTVTVPSTPRTLRSGTFGAWPLRQPFGTIPALTVTAQPITRIDTAAGPVVLFAATEGMPVELQLEGVAAADVRGADVREAGGTLIAVPRAAPGLGTEVTVAGTTLVFLDPATADAVWQGDIDGRESVVLWAGEGWFDDEGFRVVEPAQTAVVDVYPALGRPDLDEVPGAGTVFTRYAVPAREVVHALDVPAFDTPAVAPVRTGGSSGRLSAPTDADFAALTPVEVPVPDELFDQAERLILRLDWTGDAVRVHAGDRLIADQFWSGRPVEVDLTPHRDAIRAAGLRLRAFAWAPDSGVHVDPRVRPTATEPVLAVHAASLHTVRTRVLR